MKYGMFSSLGTGALVLLERPVDDVLGYLDFIIT